MQTSKEERAQWAELCARLPERDSLDAAEFNYTARTALPRLLADYDELECKVREYFKMRDCFVSLEDFDKAEAALRVAVEGEK